MKKFNFTRFITNKQDQDAQPDTWPRVIPHGGNQLRLLTDSLPVLISYVDKNQHYQFVNRTYTEWFGVANEQIVDAHLREVLGEDAYQAILPHVTKVLTTGETVIYEQYIHYKVVGSKYMMVTYVPDRAASGEVQGFFSLVQDITERKRREANQALLTELADELSTLSTADEIVQKVGVRLGGYLGISACVFADIDIDQDMAVIKHSWNQADKVPEVIGTYKLSEFIHEEFILAATRGETVIVRNTQSDSRIDAHSHAALNFYSFVSVPFIREGKLKYLVSFNATTARDWLNHEIELMEEKANRLCLRLERARAEEAIRVSEEKLALELADTRQLQKISTQLIQQDNLDVLYDDILNASIALMKSDMASLQMLNPRTGNLELLTHIGFHPESAAFWQFVTPDSGSTCGESLRSSERVIITDVDKSDYLIGSEDFKYFELSGIKAVQTTPLFARNGQLVGMISTHWKEVHTPSGRELRMFDLLARQAADLIERKQSEEHVRKTSELYQTLFNSIDEGFCICQMIYDEDGVAVDYRFLEVNPSYLRLTGLTDVVGKTGRQLEPDLESKWFQIYSQVVETGKSVRFESHLKAWNKWYDLFVTRVGDQEERKFAILFNDITERKLSEKAMTDANSRKDEFLATLSHELRNPLTPIKSSLELMGKTSNPELEQKIRGIMKRQVDKMVHLIDDLMDISRITRGKINLKRQIVTFTDALDVALETVTSPMDEAQHDFSIDIPEEPIYLYADPDRIIQILTNLLTNAIKYTPSGGKISLKASLEANQLVVRVKDNGIGIPAEHLETIFLMFSQITPAKGRSQNGLGIGLSLVKNLVEMHDGTISAHSDGEGKGSEFVVSLPLVPEEVKSQWEPFLPEQKSVAAVKAVFKILVVDDNVDIADTTKAGLLLQGHEVQACYSGLDALEMATKFLPRVALLDIGLPDIDGNELAKRLKAQFPDILLIAHSGWGQETDKLKSKAAGFDYHLVKPAGIEDILKILSSRF